MANTAFDHASALTIPGSTTNNGLVRWGDTSGTSFGNITGITSDGSNITLLTRGEIRFSDADSTHFIALESPATVSTSYTMTLPAAVPSASDYLKVTSYSGGAGVLEWASVSADTNTTYTTSWVDSSANAILRLTPSSGSADDLTIVAGSNITLTPSGDNLTIAAAAGGAALTGSTNNTITTVTGADAIQGEASLTFDNAALAFNRSHDGNNAINLINDSNTSSASTRLTIQCAGASAGDAVALFHAGGDSYIIGVDNSDSNKFKIAATGGNLGTNDRFVMTSVGEVTMPSQPAFFAQIGTVISNVTGAGTTYIIVFQSEIFDQNSDFDGSSTFTAPVTGRYFFWGFISLENVTAASTNGQITFNASNRIGYSMTPSAHHNNGNVMPDASTFLDMDANDTCTLGMRAYGESSNIIDINPGTYFSGYLVV